ncbi:unnamed protein product [Nesidiocoris tenuis]|uniref:Uncharacterized protein n=1 Tax=Nesidiocoris tenuis TaxID=355587 RepID=A0A6H5HBD3_9HEMI|nr:unnamed protein product [Nesidiocoris tenuis]
MVVSLSSSLQNRSSPFGVFFSPFADKNFHNRKSASRPRFSSQQGQRPTRNCRWKTRPKATSEITSRSTPTSPMCRPRPSPSAWVGPGSHVRTRLKCLRRNSKTPTTNRDDLFSGQVTGSPTVVSFSPLHLLIPDPRTPHTPRHLPTPLYPSRSDQAVATPNCSR